jgi:mono/diheme cytochrome c family protein
MIIAIIVAVVTGDCYGPRQNQLQVVYQQRYAYKTIPLYVATTGNDADRLRTLEDAVLRLTQVAEQQQLLLQQQSGSLQLQSSQHELGARRILQKSCVSCHSGAAPKGDLDLTGSLDVGEKLLIAETVLAGEMPPEGKPPLSDDDAKLLYDWSREDRAAVREFYRKDVLK